MTVSKAITEWLKGYDMCVVRVDTDQIGDGTDSLGIFKSPTRERTDFLESSYQITEWYQLFVVREGQENRDREDNDEWLENFAYWVDDCQYTKELPKLDNHRTCEDIELAGTPYMFEAIENNTVLYQVTLKITYTREREVEDEW